MLARFPAIKAEHRVSLTAPHIATSKHEILREVLRAQGWLPDRDVIVLSDGEPTCKTSSAAQQSLFSVDKVGNTRCSHRG
jgi:hypothetical protein